MAQLKVENPARDASNSVGSATSMRAKEEAMIISPRNGNRQE
jgi:hypothetical protein